jgi:sugar-specific transcriptional regulator TrmB
MLETLFDSLQFSKKETLVYTALLELGSERASEIAKKTGLNRTSVYDILEVLMQKGLVSKSSRGSVTFFNSLDPKQLVSYLEREKAEKIKMIDRQKMKVEELMPQLVSLQNIYSTKPKVQFFEGEKGMREAYEDTLSSKRMILAFANVETMHEGLADFFPAYYKRRAEKKIFIRAICPRNKLSIERSKLDQEEMRETRFLPANNEIFSPEENIYENKVLFASWKEKMAIMIESKELADLQRIIFNGLWDNLKKNEKF